MFSARNIYWSALLCVALLLFSAFGASYAAEKNGSWTFNLNDVDVRAFVEQVSSITGESFVIDPQVKGKVTVVSSKAMDIDEVNELFLTVLRVNGYTAVTTGNVTRIVPQSGAKTGGREMVTRVIPVKSANMDETVKLLKPLASPAGYVEGSAFMNSLIVSDYADNVSRIMKALAGLDQDNDGEVEIIPLREAWVGNIAPLIETLSPAQLAETGKGRNRLRVVADENNNSIIIKGDKAARAKIRKLVETLDQRNTNGNGIQLIQLHYADARQLAALLRGIVMNEKKDIAAAPANALAPAGTVGLNDPTAANAAINSLFAPAPDAAQKGNEPAAQDIASVQSFIQADVALNALVVKAEPNLMSEIRNLVKQLDVRRPQVLIEAAIVEITSTQADQLGVQLAGGDVARGIHAGTTQFSTTTGLSIGGLLTQLGSANAAAVSGQGAAIALGVKDKFDILIQALASTAGANLLSTPSITTMDNEEAKIVVGQNVPFRTGSFTTLSSGVTNPFTTIERQDVGITLKVKPQINEGNLVRLNIQQEVSSVLDSSLQASTPGAADIITNKRTIQTNVLAEDGETVVLGGLMSDDATSSVDKVPVLGDIPVLGALFSSKRQSLSKRNLLVFLRPTVLQTREQASGVTQQRYDRLRELQLGGKMETASPTVDTVFDPPPKTLPWLLK